VRADLGGFAADGVLALAGFGVLWGAGLLRREPLRLLRAAGLAYLVGSAVVPLALIALLTLGVPLDLVTFLAVAGVCVAGGAGARRFARGREASTDGGDGAPTGAVDWWVAAACGALLAAFFISGLTAARASPLDDFDAWSIWTLKAAMLWFNDTLPVGFFTGESYEFAHQDYPLLLPVFEAIHFRAAGTMDTRLLDTHVWLFLPAFVLAVADLAWDSVRPAVWAPVLLLVAVASEVQAQLLTAYADVPMAIFGAAGALLLGLWLARGDGRHLALGAILLAGAASSKNEGLMVAAAVLIVAGAVVLVSKRAAVRPLALAALGTGVAILPWRIWIADHGIEGDLPVFKGLNPAYLWDRFDRVGPSIEALTAQLANQGKWSYLVPLAVLVGAACFAARVARPLAAFYLGSGVLMWALLVWAYWISPLPLTFHLDTSANRVVAAIVFVAGVAIVHLSGQLLASARGDGVTRR